MIETFKIKRGILKKKKKQIKYKVKKIGDVK